MWASRLLDLLAEPPAFLQLPTDDAPDAGAFRGRYLTIDDVPCALGRFVAQGDEAIVHELVDLRRGTCEGVVKICRFRPGTDRYVKWAVPQRLERNPHSTLADVEMFPARLIAVEGGAVKVQPYLVPQPATAWATSLPADPVHQAIRDGRHLEALAIADSLLSQHGPRGALLEARGLALATLDRDDEAVSVLEAAVEAHVREGNAATLSASCVLAGLLWNLYWRSPGEGGTSMTFELTGLGAYSQTIFTDVEVAAADDTRQDRSILVLLEALAKEPYCVRALALAGHMILDEPAAIEAAEALRRAVDLIDPASADIDPLREWLDGLQDARERQQAPTEHAPPLPDPASVNEHMSAFDAHYQPEPQRGRQAAARAASARYWLSRGDVTAAERELRAALELDPAGVDHHIALVRHLHDGGRLDEAADVAERAETRFPNEPDVLEAVADLSAAQGRLSRAKTALLRTLWLEPDDPVRIEVKLGYVLADLGDRDAAINVVQRAIDRTDDERAISTLADILARPALSAKQASDESGVLAALEVLRQGLQRHPGSARLYAARALYLVQTGRYHQAAEHLRLAIQLDPTHPFAESLLRDIDDALGFST